MADGPYRASRVVIALILGVTVWIALWLAFSSGTFSTLWLILLVEWTLAVVFALWEEIIQSAGPSVPYVEGEQHVDRT